MAQLAVRPATGRTFFNDLFGFDPFQTYPNTQGGYGLGFQIEKLENGYRAEFPVPGFKPGEIDVTVEDRVLTVSGKNDKRQFTRTMVLPDDIDLENLGATVEHGMLTLELKLHAKAQPRKIKVTPAN